MKKYIKNKLLILVSLMVCTLNSMGQSAFIARIVNQNNEPIKGATIVAKFSQKEIISGKDGVFLTDQLNNGDSLYVYADGYAVTRAFYKKGEELTVIIRPVEYWEANVPVFWGNQTRKYLTGAYDRLNTRILGATPAASLINAFSGRVPSLVSVQGTSVPGYEEPNIGIRGIATMNDNKLNTFVDGYNRDYSNLDPEEIEELVFLKDAASIAQFGLAGANKGIYVTTKRGKAYQNKITFHSQLGFQKPTKLPTFLESYDYATLFNEARANDGLTPFYTDAAIAAYKNNSDPYLYPNVNWRDELIKDDAAMQRHTLSLQGGNNAARYFVMMGYLQQDGLFKYGDINKYFNTSTGYKRYTFRTNFDLNINKYISVALDLSGRLDGRNGASAVASSNEGEIVNGANTIWANISKYPPTLFPMINKDGSIGGNNTYRSNPYALITQSGYRINEERYFQGRLKTEGDLRFILSGLKSSVGMSFDSYLRANQGQSRTFAVYEYKGEGLPYLKYGVSSAFGNRFTSQFSTGNVFFDADLTYNKKWNKSALNSQLKYWQVTSLPHSVGAPVETQQLSLKNTFVHADKYVAEAVVSYSGSGEFAPGHYFGVFPTISGAWIVSNENFLKNSKAINFLKFRGSYGTLGNDKVNFGARYPFVQLVNPDGVGTTLGESLVSYVGATETGMGNVTASWETALMRNIGIDAEFFNGFIKLSVDYYKENRDGIVVVPATISALLGAPAIPRLNLGKVLNQGFDADITFHKNITKNTALFLRAVGSYYKNTRSYFDEPTQEHEWLQMTGTQINQPTGLVYDGLFKNQAEIDAAAKSSYRAVLKPGDIRYKDLNGDKIINAKDMKAMGYNSDRPEINYGLTLGGNYKGLEVSVLFHGMANRTVFLNNNSAFNGFYNGSRPTDYIMNRWTPTNIDNATFPRLTTTTDAHNYQNSDFWLKDASFIRLKNVEVSYTVPTTVSSRLRLQGMRVYLNGNNLYVWDKLKIVDPEGPTAGVTTYPLVRTVNVGLRVEI